MNLIQALRLPNSQAVMTNIARFHYQNIYNVGLSPPIVTQSNLTFQIKGYTRNYRFLRLDYACVIYIADRIAVVASNGIDTLSSGFSGCYMASFRHNGIRYVAHIPTPNNSIKTSWNRAVKNRIIDNVVLFKPTEGLARIPGTIGIWGIITFNDRCYRLDVNENAPPSQAIRGQRIFNSIPRNPILTEIPPIAGGQMP